MNLAAALLLPLFLQDQEAPPPLPKTPADEPAAGGSAPSFTFLPGFRVGGWWLDAFEALTPAGSRRIDSTLLFDAGIDLRAEYGGWTLALSADYGSSQDFTVAMGGLLLGRCWKLGDDSPFFLQLSAGPIFGQLDVSTAGFGDFKSAAGGEARLSATVAMHDRIEVMFWLDYRQIRFKYDDPVTSGDKEAGGATFALGAGLLMRF